MRNKIGAVTYSFAACVALLLLQVSSPSEVKADVTLSDGNWGAPWSLGAQYYQGPGNGGGSTMTATTIATGGNPDFYYKQTTTIANAIGHNYRYGIENEYLFSGASYDPSQGAILTLDFRIDIKKFTGGGLDVDAALMLEQNGMFYRTNVLLTMSNNWTTLSQTGYTQNSFGKIVGDPTGTGSIVDFTMHPDFSSTGAPINFGFASGHSTSVGGGGYTIMEGFDNWSITLHTAQAICNSDDIFVGNVSDGTVVRFSKTDIHNNNVGSTVIHNLGGHPEGMALDSAGNVIVAGRTDNTVYRLTPNGTSCGTTVIPFSEGPSFDTMGNLFINSNSTGPPVTTSTTFTAPSASGCPGPLSPSKWIISYPATTFAEDTRISSSNALYQKSLYVLLSELSVPGFQLPNGIEAWSATAANTKLGTIIFDFGTAAGLTPGSFRCQGMALDSQGDIWVCEWSGDVGPGRLLEFSSAGCFQRMVTIPGSTKRLAKIAISAPNASDPLNPSRNTLYVTDRDGNKLYILDEVTGNVLYTLTSHLHSPQGVAVCDVIVKPPQPPPCQPGWSAGPPVGNECGVGGVRMVGVYFPLNGKFYAMGGRSSDSAGSDFTHPFEYDPSVPNKWTIKPDSYLDNQVNNMACGVLTDPGTSVPWIYCVGGSAAGQTMATNRVFRYDPVNGVLQTITASWPGDTDGITLPGGFAVSLNRLYVFGGFRINTGMVNTSWRFTPSAGGTGTWVQVANLPVALSYIPTATSDLDGCIYMAGGSTWDGTTLHDSNFSFRYCPNTDTFNAIPTIPRSTAETRALSFNGKILVMGGGRDAPNPSNEVDTYDPATQIWTTTSCIPVPGFVTPRRNFPTDTNGTNRIWLAGGYAIDGLTPLSSMEIFP